MLSILLSLDTKEKQQPNSEKCQHGHKRYNTMLISSQSPSYIDVDMVGYNEPIIHHRVSCPLALFTSALTIQSKSLNNPDTVKLDSAINS